MRRSAPRSSRWLAKAWRSTWGETRAGSISGGKRELLQLLAEALAGKAPARADGNSQGDTPGLRLVVGDAADGAQRFARRLVQRHEPLAPAFALDGEHAVVGDEHLARQRDQLGDAQARGVERFEQRVETERAAPRHAVAARVAPSAAVSSNVSTSASDRIFGNGRGSRGLSIAEQGSSSRMPSARQEAEELADGRELPRARGGRQTLAREGGEIGAEMIGRGVRALRPCRQGRPGTPTDRGV